MSKQIELTLSKETKGTFVYASIEDNSLITTLYLQKSQMPAEAPKRVTVTVAFDQIRHPRRHLRHAPHAHAPLSTLQRQKSALSQDPHRRL